MSRQNYQAILDFIAVAREKSFTRAARSGEQLPERVAPKFLEIEREMEALTAIREKPAGKSWLR